jgi:nitroreductase
MSEVLKLLETRRSKRALSEEKLPSEVVDRLMRAATLSPSCSNNQPWRFVLAQSDAALAKVHESLKRGNYWATRAPLIVLVISNPDLDCKANDNREYALFDTGMGVFGMLVQAEQEGLYAHPMAGFDAEKMKAAFGIEDPFQLVTVIAVGYPASDTSMLNEKHQEQEDAPRSRKPIEEIVFHDEWPGR